MPEADIPFPLTSSPGRAPSESGGRLLNSYAEALGEKAGSPFVIRRVPGLVSFAVTAETPSCRGYLEVNGVVYAVIGHTMFAIASDGTSSVVGAVAGDKKVYMARNNKVPAPDIVLVTENGAFIVTSTSIVAYSTIDPDLPVPISVTAQDGYFIFPIGDGRAFNSALNDTAIDSSGFVKAESKPDGLLRIVPFNNQIIMFGPYSAEFWIDTANPSPAFPYSRSTAISRGLAGIDAIAGWQDGFGAAALIWVADHNRVVQLNGYAPVDISPPDLDRLIEATADKSTLEALVYVAAGQARWVLSSPTWTWEYNLATKKWNERASYGLTRWRATQSVWAFGKWLVGDTQTGNVYQVNDMAFKEDADFLVFLVESGPVQDFPNRTRIGRADFDFATGVGLAAGALSFETDPTAQFSWSDDGGSSWSNPVFRALGQQGKTKTRVTIARCGTSGPRGRRWRLIVSDDVYVSIVKGKQSTDLRLN